VAVASEVSKKNGFNVFLSTIPYNFYALMTILMVFFISFTGRDFGPMKKAEEKAKVEIPGENAGPKADQAKGHVMDLVLPILVLVVISVGSLMRYTRTNMLEVLNSDYIRTARAKGLSERKVIYKHAFRNTLIPLVTIIGGSLPGLFSGALITETLFSIPGIGYASYHAMVAGDIPFSMFYLTFIAVLTLLGNLIADILYAVVDPRVRIA